MDSCVSSSEEICTLDFVDRAPREVRVPRYITTPCYVLSSILSAGVSRTIDDLIQGQVLEEHREKFSSTVESIKDYWALKHHKEKMAPTIESIVDCHVYTSTDGVWRSILFYLPEHTWVDTWSIGVNGYIGNNEDNLIRSREIYGMTFSTGRT